MDTEYLEKIRNIFDLSGRVAIVTGAAGGLGQIITAALVAFGSHVVLASRNYGNLKQLEENVSRAGGEALAVATDVTQEDQVDRLVSETMKRFKKIDILINNSGLELREPAEEMRLESWHKVMETNVTGAFLCSQRVGRTMIPRKSGKIINMSSIRGKVGRVKNFIAYCASKGGLDSLTRALACEWGPHNIQVNGIAPCLIETEMSRHSLQDPNWIKDYVARIPLRRWGQHIDLVGCIVFLASDASNFVNGHTLYLDGGYTIS